MRKNNIIQAENLISLLAEAHEQIADCIEKNDTDQAAAMLMDCQDGAIALGTMIEDSEGEGTETVSELERYCELVYKLHETLAGGGHLGANSTLKKLTKAADSISEIFHREIRLITEVVFLPYKASMWDSLETVWAKAEADPDCNAVVIPIPYFDKKPDGSLGQAHLETTDFPDYVPTVKYDQYDFAGRHPDIIYIHNPYDDHNYVTSVHPLFYSDKLKKFTDNLTYIPYFVLAETDPDNPKAVKSMEHFAQTPGVVNADRVIVQSENMRKCYIEAMVNAFGESCRTEYKKKIIGSGSPKTERLKLMKALAVGDSIPTVDYGSSYIENLRITAADIPQKWSEKICCGDGSRRKVILYNTGVNAMLQDAEGMLEKIEDTLRLFSTKKDDVVLLWRPHPLISATLESMRPELADRYAQIVRKYITDDFGIYDDSADLDRALTTADAYYGDQSSLVQLCRAIDMPVMIQNVKIQNF